MRRLSLSLSLSLWWRAHTPHTHILQYSPVGALRARLHSCTLNGTPAKCRYACAWMDAGSSDGRPQPASVVYRSQSSAMGERGVWG